MLRDCRAKAQISDGASAPKHLFGHRSGFWKTVLLTFELEETRIRSRTGPYLDVRNLNSCRGSALGKQATLPASPGEQTLLPGAHPSRLRHQTGSWVCVCISFSRGLFAEGGCFVDYPARYRVLRCAWQYVLPMLLPGFSVGEVLRIAARLHVGEGLILGFRLRVWKAQAVVACGPPRLWSPAGGPLAESSRRQRSVTVALALLLHGSCEDHQYMLSVEIENSCHHPRPLAGLLAPPG